MWRTFRVYLPLAAQLLRIAAANPQAVAPMSTSTVTVRIPVGTCPVPSTSGEIIVYTTTNANGSGITTSSTSYITEPPFSEVTSATEVTYTTTNSLGSTITTSSLSSYSSTVTQAPSTTVITSATEVNYTTTNSLGSTIMTSTLSIYTSPETSAPSTTSELPGAASSPCPAGIDALYTTDNGGVFELFCLADFLYNDLPASNASTFWECMDDCVTYVPTAPGDFGDLPCVAVTWTEPTPGNLNCYLKSSIADVVYGTTAFDSAKLLSYNPPVGSVAVSVVSSGTGSSTLAASTTNTAPTTTYSVYQPASPCPYPNQTIYTDNQGVEYQIQCGIDYEYSDLPSVNVDTFAACMLACSVYVPAPIGDRYVKLFSSHFLR
jgi:hypothetical protein